MENTLKTLQALQVEALAKGIHAFHIDAHNYDDNERGLGVTIFLKGDDSDGDYSHFVIYEGTPQKIADATIETIKDIVANV